VAPHAGARAREAAVQCDLLRCVVPSPFRASIVDAAWRAWEDGCVVKLARGIEEERAFERLPILADALEEAGCADEALLGHCRGPGPHALGCWVVDAVLDRS
jgi:hypothetical protein